MGVEVCGLFGLIVLIADVWAVVKTIGSQVSTGKKVFWTVLILILPVLGLVIWFVAGPRQGMKHN